MISLGSKNLKQVKRANKFFEYDNLWIMMILFGVFGLFVFIFVLSGIITVLPNLLFGLSLILIAIGLIGAILRFFTIFGISEIKHIGNLEQAISSQRNLIDYLNYDGLLAIQEAMKFAREKKIAVFSPTVLIAGLALSKRSRFILGRLGFNFHKFADYFNQYLSDLPKGRLGYISSEIEKAFEIAAKIAISENRNEIDIGDLFLGAAQADPFSQKVIFDLNLKLEDLENVVYWEKKLNYQIEYRKKFWERNLKERTGGIGQDWASGWTPNLMMYASPVRVGNVFSTYENSAHKQEVDELERILSRKSKNNVTLVGPPGVGKKSVVFALADKILKGQTLAPLRNKHIYVLNTGTILASESKGQIEQKLIACLNDAVHAGNVILFIDDLASLIGGGESKVGEIDASSVLIPYLQNSGLQFISTLALRDYHSLFEPNQGLSSNFERIQILEPKPEQAILILEEHIPYIEYHNNVYFTYDAIKKIIELSGKYIQNKLFPAKALDLASEIAVFVSSRDGENIVTGQDVENVISQKVKIPTGQLQKTDREKLLNLENILHKRVVDQNEAIKAIASAMRRARAGLSATNRPIGSFLFLGPTGVGKTETAKALAEAYFGSENDMIRLDMSEYQDSQAVQKLIGGAPGTGAIGEGGYLTKQVLDKPFSVILLDEVEKSHPDILNLFLQVLDDGRLTDNMGRTIDFTNTMIIATSNAGAELIRQEIKAGTLSETLREKLMEHLQSRQIFRPEFLNRFDGIISFSPLPMPVVIQIAKIMIEKLRKNLYDKKQINLIISEKAIEKIAQLGYDPTLGARPLRRVIQERVENKIAEKLIAEELKPGSSMEINEQDI